MLMIQKKANYQYQKNQYFQINLFQKNQIYYFPSSFDFFHDYQNDQFQQENLLDVSLKIFIYH